MASIPSRGPYLDAKNDFAGPSTSTPSSRMYHDQADIYPQMENLSTPITATTLSTSSRPRENGTQEIRTFQVAKIIASDRNAEEARPSVVPHHREEFATDTEGGEPEETSSMLVPGLPQLRGGYSSPDPIAPSSLQYGTALELEPGDGEDEFEHDSVGEYIDEYGHWPFSDEDDQILMEEEADREFFSRAPRMPSGVALIRTSTPVGAEAYGFIITRKRMRRSFYETLDKAHLLSYAVELFNRNGSLKKEFIDHQIKRGTGVWGEELTKGDLLFVVNVKVQEYRKGHGTFVLRKLIEKAREQAQINFILAYAVVNEPSLDADSYSRQSLEPQKTWAGRHMALQRFFNHTSFCRIGITRWFCLAYDGDHPSRSAHFQDYHPPLSIDFDGYGNRLPDALSKEFEAIYPAHAALSNIENDEQCLQCLYTIAARFPSPWAWYTYVHRGNSVLHLAATYQKPKCARWLISSFPTLTNSLNLDGNTPLESLTASLDRQRSYIIDGKFDAKAAKYWTGYSDSATDTVMALQGMDTNDATTRIKVKYGCTCRRCAAGRVSPRMQRLLCHYAEIISIQLEEGAEDMNDRHWRSAKLWYYVPRVIRDTMPTNKDQRHGFAQLCHLISICLESKRKPTPSAIQGVKTEEDSWPDYMATYLEAGGTVDSAVHLIIDRAEELDHKWYTDDETLDDFLHSPNSELYEDLKPCRNDEDFDSARLGLVDSERPYVPLSIPSPEERVKFFSQPRQTMNLITGERGLPRLRNPFQDIIDEVARRNEETEASTTSVHGEGETLN